jgi:tripartite-type tricarboxylate transporter receptor subunit TctC
MMDSMFATRRMLAACAGLVFALFVPLALGQTYPTKPVRMVLPFSPGGGTDILARLVAQGLTEAWGQTVIVDNRPGGGGAIAGRLVVNANPDGYTLYMPSGTIIAANPHIYPKLGHDPRKDLAPISIVATSPQVIVVRSDFRAKSVKELIALAKAKPGTIRYSSAGVGSQTHLAAESFAHHAGIDIVHVPYKSGGQSATAVLSGEVAFTVANVPVAVGHVKQGRMHALGVISLEPLDQLPGVPTVSETLPGFENEGWWPLMAPAGTPKAIIDKIQRDVARVLQAPDIRSRLQQLALEPVGSTSEAFARQLDAEFERWGRIVRERKLQGH